MNQNLQIIKAKPENSDIKLAIQKTAFQSEAQLHNNFNIPPLVQSYESIIKDFQHYTFFKAVLNNRIVGAVKTSLIENNIVWIGRLVVHPDFQRQEIGSALMNYIEVIYAEAFKFMLFTTEKSIQNIQFYENHGYNITGSITEPGHDNIALVKMEKPVLNNETV
ncbi:MAG: GNAT family N-acetyltransferase [Bacteroidales bacterium]|nr:GNAT family N-acetyltransferase [Bacteroidales bacterium]